MVDLLYRSDFLGHLLRFNILWSVYALILTVIIHVLIKEFRFRYNYIWTLYISIFPLLIISYYFDFFPIPIPQREIALELISNSANKSVTIDYAFWAILLSIIVAVVNYCRRMLQFVDMNQEISRHGKRFEQEICFHKYPILLTQTDCSPYVYGVFKPVIIISESLLKVMNPTELEHILLHEGQHIKHHDYLKNAVQKCVRALFYYNPIILLLDSYLDDLRESACDLEVITRKGSSKDYAQTLYHINEMVQQKVGGLATVPFIRKTSQLKRRILRMRNVQKNDGKISRLIVTGLITASTIFIACSDTTGLEEKEIDNAQFSNVKLQKIEKAQAEKKQMAEKSKNVFFGSEIELEKKLTEEQKKLFQKQLDKEFELADDKDKSGNLHFSEEREFKIRQLKEKEISGNVKLRPKKELFEIRPDGFTKEEQNKIRQFKTEGDTKQLKEYIEKRAATKTLHDKRNTVKLRELKEKPKTDN